MSLVHRSAALWCTCILLLTACDRSAPPPKPAGGTTTKPAKPSAGGDEIPNLAVFAPALPTEIPAADNPMTPAKIDLGRMLYYETRISKNHDVSCNTCHALDKYGVDGAAVSTGHRGQKGGRGAPTVYHAAGHIAQFWDGRALTVEEQAKGPVLNAIEMAMPSEAAVIKVLKSMPGYVEAFGKAFPKDKDPVTYDNYAKAVGAFERRLVTPAPIDKFFAGDKTALTEQQQQGLKHFMQVGCITCHNGPYFGGRMYQKVGLIKPWPNQKDQGRYDLTKREEDRMMFKVMGLRNIAKTAPYFHDGSADTLAEAVQMMARHQLGRELGEDQVTSMVAFLESLTGELPLDYIKKPKLPASTEQTPKPDPT
ncbi:MAG: cytochrome-c peroxidase [Phycisphaerae bacterium]|nr:cytochrome-c peroxidase [Phycisphaerae bacterium]